MKKIENEKIEIELLLQAILLKYGYDFRTYAKSSLKRRIMRRLSLSGVRTISELQYRIIYDLDFFETLLLDLSINVTQMFRDPLFYKAIREDVVPVLRDLQAIKVWHAGCATGEEVYSMAILLKEEGLYDKSRIYATDFNEKVLRTSKEGIYPIERIKDYTRNYIQSGGHSSFADYYSARYDFVIMDSSLRKNVVFADHNLVTDGVFSEMDLIVCRNVLIYFNRELQNRVFKLFSDSLNDEGFLCLGSKETVRYSDCSDNFKTVSKGQRIYRKRIIKYEDLTLKVKNTGER
ncbi:MAG: protein-glutamate O-methyltransferase CheR [Thermodesulfobacteriota bacterium]|nr:protein-glutamate O-methyltransferase CheR [Thermodesulfobacteriota bacterium]